MILLQWQFRLLSQYPVFVLQSWEERAGAGAARPQEGGHQDAGCSRGDRPRRPGEHALSGLLQGQGETDQRPAV